MSAHHGPLVIVGASYAGVALAAAARADGFDDEIVLIGEERDMPYQRPPLSKGFLLGNVAPDQLLLRGDAFYAENRIELHTGTRVTQIDPAGRTVELSDGRALRYGWLALTTGARCRELVVPGARESEVHLLRTLEDARRLVDRTREPRRICIVGGGFIGLEIASALAQRGHEVCVVEVAPRLLARVLPPSMSTFMHDIHRLRGVRIIMGRGVAAIVGSGGQTRAVQLDDGTLLECDLVIAGIGVSPRDDLAARAGIAIHNGILVDRHARTSARNVLAAGDCASFDHPFSVPGTGPIRPESIQTANDMARAAASTVVGRSQPYAAVPWFWSDQFEFKLQMAGLPGAHDQLVTRGSIEDGRFTVFALRAGRITAAYSVNRPAEHMAARKLVGRAAVIDPDHLADLSIDIKTLDAASPASLTRASAQPTPTGEPS